MTYWKRKGEDFEKIETLGSGLIRTIIKKEDIFLKILNRMIFYDNSIHNLKEENEKLKKDLEKIKRTLEHFNLHIIEEDDY